MRRRQWSRSIIPLGVLAMAMWGCSSLPTTPVLDPQPNFVKVPLPPGGALSASEETPSEVSGEIDGALGGTLTHGRFQLVVPPGAFSGVATLTIRMPDPAEMRCELHITPEEANQFAVPVQLVADCSGAEGVDFSKLETLWFDESAGVWVLVRGSATDAVGGRIVTPLDHFSIYGIVEGKAGW